MAELPPLRPNAKSDPLRSILRSVITNTPYTFLGQGTYGTIIDPALPNMNANGVYSYPNSVTKFYKKKPAMPQSDNFRKTIIEQMHLDANKNKNMTAINKIDYVW